MLSPTSCRFYSATATAHAGPRCLVACCLLPAQSGLPLFFFLRLLFSLLFSSLLHIICCLFQSTSLPCRIAFLFYYAVLRTRSEIILYIYLSRRDKAASRIPDLVIRLVYLSAPPQIFLQLSHTDRLLNLIAYN